MFEANTKRAGVGVLKSNTVLCYHSAFCKYKLFMWLTMQKDNYTFWVLKICFSAILNIGMLPS